MSRSVNSFILRICCAILLAQISLAYDLRRNLTPLFVFGDSHLDPGNNNYINTEMRANYAPYGMTYFHNATGRFSDGRTTADFIAEYANLSLLHPYLENVNQSSFDGVNFASAGAGAQDMINNGSVFPLKQQIESFKKVKFEMSGELGADETNTLLSKSVYLFSIGGNDILVPFIFDQTQMFQKLTFEEYTDCIIGNLTTNLKELYKEGGRKFAFMGLDALGCQPGMLEINFAHGIETCHENSTQIAKLFNHALLQTLQKLSTELQGFKYSYLDSYTLMKDIVANPAKHGFKESVKACCGRGKFLGIPSCGGQRRDERIGKEFQVCDNPADYVYFDSSHFSEETHRRHAKLFWSGPTNIPGSYTMEQLFKEN